MKRMISILTMSALGLLWATACSRSSPGASADSSLARDLALAAHQRDSLDSVSAVESQRLSPPAKPAYRAEEDPPYHSRSSTASGEVSHNAKSSATSGTTSGATSGAVEKHTQRDAALGAATGAVIGAVASRNKVKGGLVGAAVGGIVGAVIGNNVDKTKKKP